MKKLLSIFVLLILFAAVQAQGNSVNKKQTVDYIESIFKSSYQFKNFKVSSVVLDGKTLISTYSDGDVYKKDLTLKGPLKITQRSGKYSVDLQAADMIVFGNLKSEDDATKLKNALQFLIDLLQSDSGTTPKENGLTQFENEKLATIQDVFHNTTKQTVTSFLKGKGYGDPEIDEAFDEYGDAFYFVKTYSRLEIEYSKTNKIINATNMYGGAMNNVFIEMELEEKGYKPLVKKIEEGDGKKKEWSKPDSKYIFVTMTDEENKMGILGYGTFEE